MIEELRSEQVRRVCDAENLGCRTLEEIQPREGIIGQHRAVEALEFGLDISGRGFNIYVAGLHGTGRTTAVQSYLEERAQGQQVPPDWVYVNNFKETYRPIALQLPAGQGRQLQKDVKEFVERVGHDIRQAFESEEYGERKESIQGELEQQQQAVLEEMKKRSLQDGFALQITPMGMVFVPLDDAGKAMDEKAFVNLGAVDRQQIEQRQVSLKDDLKDALKDVRDASKKVREEVEKLDTEVALYALGLSVDELTDKYSELPDVVSYLKQVGEDLLEDIGQFRGEDQESGGPALPWTQESKKTNKYEVNVIVDNSSLEGAPVVIDLNPTYHDLFGRIEKEARMGALHTDFTLIRPGSIHRANGGYLVLPVEEILRNLFVWDGIKRAVRNGEIDIEELGERLGYISTRGLQPECIPFDCKVVLIGNPYIYHLLYQLDEDFNELFKVKADFDSVMDRTDDNVHEYIASLCRLCRDEELKPMVGEATAKVVEQSSRLADDQEKLSMRFAEIADLIREANFWADKDGSELIEAKHIQQAVEKKIYRSNLIQERIQEMITRGSILIDTEGTVPGQINGLAVTGLGDYSFGRPSRITASVGIGRGGIVDIEREAKMGGNIHTKGVLILSGYLMNQYATDKPLSLSARLVFEQSYSGVDGDSASSTELYALLSALSGLPIRQDVAVTGSVNQQGEVQAIGGVNEKIEGYYEVCKARGLTGQQGVMIPHSNVQNLMLKEEVVSAIDEGVFHVWPANTIDEGIEMLTGAAAGTRGEDGKFPADTVHGKVDEKLCGLAECLERFGNGDGGSYGKSEAEE